MSETDEIKKLPPQERIKKLQELEEKKKREILETEKLIQNSIEELWNQEEKDLLPIEEIKSDNIDESMSEEAKEIIRTKKFIKKKGEGEEKKEETKEISPKREKTLQELAQEEEVVKMQEQKISLYEIAHAGIYATLKNISDRAVYGSLTREDEKKLAFYDAQLSRDFEYIKNEEVKNTLQRSEELLNRIHAYERGESNKKESDYKHMKNN